MDFNLKKYAEEFQNSKLNDLFFEKNRLLKQMDEFENNFNSSVDASPLPSKKSEYLRNCDCLCEILRIIKFKMNEDDFSNSNQTYKKHCLTKVLLELDDDERSKAINNLKK